MRKIRFSRLPTSLVATFAFSLYLLLMVGVFLIAYLPGRNTLQYWEQETRTNIEIDLQLSILSREYGYGGFIHHFKNYVIRRDVYYIQQAVTSLNEAMRAFYNLSELTENRIPAETLNTVLATSLEYQSKAEWVLANLPVARSMPIEELDRLVKVDDTAAFIALADIYKVSERHLLDSLKQSDTLHRALVTRAVFSGLFISVIYWSVSIFLFALLRLSRRSLEQLNAINRYAPVALTILDREGRCVAANEKFLQLMKVPPTRDINSIQVEELIPESVRHRHRQLRTDFIEQNRAYAMGERNRTFNGIALDGSPLKLEISIVSLNKDMPGHAMAIIKDAGMEEELRHRSTTDHLTQIKNRRFAEEAAHTEIERVNRYGTSCALMLIDVDHFKEINDHYGHTVGDEVLKQVVNTIQANLRTSDMFARWGGDEFILLLPSTELNHAVETADKLRLLVHELDFAGNIKITLSIGVTEIKRGQDYDLAFKLADSALYNAKEGGRNRIETA